jgi:hypothetical protein
MRSPSTPEWLASRSIIGLYYDVIRCDDGGTRVVWSDDGVRAAERAGVDLAEVVEALYAPSGMRFERSVGATLMIVMGMASSGRVVAVLCDEVEHTTRFRIIGCRPLAGKDLDGWRRNL